MLGRVAERARSRDAWRVGEPYRDVPVQTVRIRMGRSPGLPSRDLWRADPLDRTGPRVRTAVGLGLVAAVLLLVIGLALDMAVAGALGALAVLLGACGWALLATRAAIGRLAPSDTLGDMGRAVAEALAATGCI